MILSSATLCEIIFINDKYISKFLNFIFVNEHNKFQWLAVPVFISIITGIYVVFSFYLTRKREKEFFEEVDKRERKFASDSLELQKSLAKERVQADIVSQSRIKWIQEVRMTTANVFALYHQYSFKSEDLKDESYGKYSAEVLKLRLFFATIEFEEEENNINFNKIRNMKNPGGYLSTLEKNFPEDSSALALKFLKGKATNKGKNIYMIELINELGRNENREKTEYMSSLFSQLVVAISIYLKIDWEESKKYELNDLI